MVEIVMGALVLALIVAILHIEREHRKERAELLDRIQAPQSFQVSAMERAVADLPPVEPPPDLFTERVPEGEDIRLRALFGDD